MDLDFWDCLEEERTSYNSICITDSFCWVVVVMLGRGGVGGDGDGDSGGKISTSEFF